MKHSIKLFDSNREFSFARETVDGTSPFLYMGSVLFGGCGALLSLIPLNYGLYWPMYTVGPFLAIAWFFAWFVMPRLHVTYGMTARQIDTYIYFKELPDETQTELGGKNKVLEIVRAANKTELHALQTAMAHLRGEWERKQSALARVAPERDRVAGYMEDIKEITSRVRTERETYEEML